MATVVTDTTRERLIEAAGQHFAERGFDGTTVRDICQTAGANIAAVNYYFGDKQALYVEAVVRAHHWRMEQAQLPDWSDDTPADVRLADFIETFVRRMRSGRGDTWHSRLMMREVLQPTEACAALVQASIGPQFKLLCGILRELLPADTSDQRLHLAAFSVVGQCLFYHVADPVIRNLVDEQEYGGYDAGRLAAHISAFSAAAIGCATDRAAREDSR